MQNLTITKIKSDSHPNTSLEIAIHAGDSYHNGFMDNVHVHVIIMMALSVLSLD